MMYIYLCRDGQWRECNSAAIDHMKGIIKNLQFKLNPNYEGSTESN